MQKIILSIWCIFLLCQIVDLQLHARVHVNQLAIGRTACRGFSSSPDSLFQFANQLLRVRPAVGGEPESLLRRSLPDLLCTNQDPSSGASDTSPSSSPDSPQPDRCASQLCSRHQDIPTVSNIGLTSISKSIFSNITCPSIPPDGLPSCWPPFFPGASTFPPDQPLPGQPRPRLGQACRHHQHVKGFNLALIQLSSNFDGLQYCSLIELLPSSINIQHLVSIS